MGALLLLSGCHNGAAKVDPARQLIGCKLTEAPPIDGGTYISLRCSYGTVIISNNNSTDGYIYWYQR